MRGLTLAALLLISAIGFASQNLTATSIDKAFQQLFAPYQSKTSKVGLNFSNLTTDQIRVTATDLNAWLWVKGSNNVFDFKVNRLKYTNDSASVPRLDLSASLDLDLVKALGRDAINEYAADLDKVALDFAKDMTSEYGKAATAKAEVVHKKVDVDGNVTELELSFEANVDVAKLPADKTLADVLVLGGKAKILFSEYKTSLDFEVELNRKYKGFEKENQGLKDDLQALVDNQPQTQKQVKDVTEFLVSFAQGLASGQFRDNGKN